MERKGRKRGKREVIQQKEKQTKKKENKQKIKTKKRTNHGFFYPSFLIFFNVWLLG